MLNKIGAFEDYIKLFKINLLLNSNSHFRLVVILVLRKLRNCFVTKVTIMILWRLKKYITQDLDLPCMQW